MIVKQISEQVLPQNLHNLYSTDQSAGVSGVAGVRYLIHSVQWYMDATSGDLIDIEDSDFNPLWRLHLADSATPVIYELNTVIVVPFGKGFVVTNPGTSRDTNILYSIETK